MPNSIDLVDEVTEEVKALDRTAARWGADRDRAAAVDAIGHTDRSLVLLRRVREALTTEVREWDQQHKPYDPRD